MESIHEEILALGFSVLDNTSTPEDKSKFCTHLDGCELCREKFDEMVESDLFLRCKGDNVKVCPQNLTSLARKYAHKNLTEEVNQQIIEHLAQDKCEACQEVINFAVQLDSSYSDDTDEQSPNIKCSKNFEHLAVDFAYNRLETKEAEVSFMKHLEQGCEACTNLMNFALELCKTLEIDKTHNLNAKLIIKMFQKQTANKGMCPNDFDDIASSFVIGTLDTVEEEQFLMHLERDTCLSCAIRVKFLSDFIVASLLKGVKGP